MTTIGVPESDIGRIHSGAPMSVRIPALGVTLSGHVLDIRPLLSTATVSYPVDVRLDAPPSSQILGKLLPGMQTIAVLHTTSVQKTVYVPAASVLSLQSGATEVFVVRHGKAFGQIVQVGAMTANTYQITSGLTPGALLVDNGQNLLSNGDTVRIVSRTNS
jgi:hypothetical protein